MPRPTTKPHDPAFLEGSRPSGNPFPNRPGTKGRRRSSRERKRCSQSSPRNARDRPPIIPFLARNRSFVCCSSRDVFRCRAIFAFASIKPDLMCMFFVFTSFLSLRCRIDIFLFIVIPPSVPGNGFSSPLFLPATSPVCSYISFSNTFRDSDRRLFFTPWNFFPSPFKR